MNEKPFIDSDLESESEEESYEEKQLYLARKEAKEKIRNAERRKIRDLKEETKKNRILERKKLLESNDMKEFVKKYNEDPFNFNGDDVYYTLARNANKQFLEFLLEKQPHVYQGYDIMLHASGSNNVEFFKWLHGIQKLKYLPYDIYQLPCINGDYDTFRYLKSNNYGHDNDIMVYACKSKNIDFINKLRYEFNIPLHKECYEECLDNFSIFKYLVDNNCPYDLQIAIKINKVNDSEGWDDRISKIRSERKRCKSYFIEHVIEKDKSLKDEIETFKQLDEDTGECTIC